MVQEAEVDGIEILVNMAKQGKIDPWNVDIVEVTDKYLMHLFQSKAQNLRLTGRTLLFAAILLKLKSNVLEGIDVLDFEPQHQDEFNYDDEMPLDYEEEYIPTNNVISIDEVLQRRTSVRLNHNRVVTLRDLIRQLEFYEILSRQDKIELNELTLLGMDKISAYISLLFLTVESDYDLEQDEFYGDLYVIRREENPAEELDRSINNVQNILAEETNGTVEIQN